jgi:TolB-like protein/class 3 adenylate cyclase
MEERVDRRLAAIMAGDIAGYTRLMGADEEGTLRQLKGHRKELVDPKITEHRGRIVKTTGDGMLVEFVSVVDAVRCAVDIQRRMLERNSNTPPDKRIQFRIGINVGDIIIDSDDIYGDGVNVAARLETLADPGGIMVSRTVYDQVCDKLSFGFEDMGEQSVKNVARPIGVYRVSPAEITPLAAVRSSTAAKAEAVSSSRPSIAVLPFVNMSGDPEQEYFVDGISEDIITGLSKLRWFFVIARNSSFAYKGKAVDVKRAARELGVRYILEGSVRRAGNRVRITTQLIDASTGNHIWADRYDGDLTDIFALQDEITRKVVTAIEPRLLEAEGVRALTRAPTDLDAWELVARATSIFSRMARADCEAAIALYREAVKQHKTYAPAHSMLAFALLMSGFIGWTSWTTNLNEAADLAVRAAELDGSDPWAHLALGQLATMRRQTDAAVHAFQRALELNPNFAAAHGFLGYALALDAQSERALEHLTQALSLSPHDPQNIVFMIGVGYAHYQAGRYDDAVKHTRNALQQRPEHFGALRQLSASLAQAGRMEEARAMLERLKRLQTDVSLAWVNDNSPLGPEAMKHYLDGLRKAGLQ